MIASASGDGTIKLWRIDGQKTKTFDYGIYRAQSFSLSKAILVRFGASGSVLMVN